MAEGDTLSFSLPASSVGTRIAKRQELNMTAKLPPLETMMERLIETPSVSSTQSDIDQSNFAVVDLLANWLEDLGFAVDRMPVADKPGKANLIAVLGRGDRGLVLAGHTDTVPCDEELWSQDPFELRLRDGKWFGLGTCDMKGFFPLALTAAAQFRANELKRPLILLATADEESSMSGARALTSAQFCGARAAIIGEPTSLVPICETKGIMMLRIRIEGKSGHSSNPALGKNALDVAASVLTALLEYRQILQRRKRNTAYLVPFPTMNLGCIHGGDNPNRICDHVEVELDVRVLPGMDNHEIKDDIARMIRVIEARTELSISVELLHPPVAPFACPQDSELLDVTERLTGRQRTTAAFASEAPFLQGLGMDTLLLGPGSIDQAHQPDEFVREDQLRPTIDIIRRLIEHHCG